MYNPASEKEAEKRQLRVLGVGDAFYHYPAFLQASQIFIVGTEGPATSPHPSYRKKFCFLENMSKPCLKM